MKSLKILLSAVLVSGGVAVIVGCSDDTSDTSTIAPPVEQSNPGSVYDTDAQARVNYITSRLPVYDGHAKQLPGATEFLQRQTVGFIFDDLSDLLPKLAGPNPSAIFRQQLHIVQGTHAQLNALALDASSDSVAEAGMRGASNALEDLSTSQFADQTELSTDINALNNKLDELELVTGQPSRQVVADAAGMIGQILHTMDTVLVERLQPATAPSTAPSMSPTTNPS